LAAAKISTAESKVDPVECQPPVANPESKVGLGLMFLPLLFPFLFFLLPLFLLLSFVCDHKLLEELRRGFMGFPVVGGLSPTRPTTGFARPDHPNKVGVVFTLARPIDLFLGIFFHLISVQFSSKNFHQLPVTSISGY
jgi:hypothetical protein